MQAIKLFANHFLLSKPIQHLGMQDWAARPAGQAAALPKVQSASKQLLSQRDTGLKKPWKPNQSAFAASIVQSSKPEVSNKQVSTS